jgi:hypothetical protein
MKALYQAIAHSIVLVMHTAVPPFYHYYPFSGQNSLPVWLDTIITFLNDSQNVLKKSRSLVSLREM